MQKLKRPLNSDARQHFITRNNSKNKDLNSKCRISLSLNSANQVNLPNRLPGQQARQVVNDKKGNQHSRSLTAIATAAPSTTTAIAMKAIIKTRGRTGPTLKTTPAPCRVTSAGKNAKTTVHKHYLPQQCYINGFIVLVIVISKFALTLAISDNAADNLWASTTPLMHVDNDSDRTTTEALTAISAAASAATEADMTTKTAYWRRNGTAPLGGGKKNTMGAGVGKDSIFMYFAKRLSIGNELWDGIVRECYRRPTFTCFQKNVFVYLNDALDAHDVNVTQRLKFYKNQVNYDSESPATESALSEDGEGDSDGDGDGDGADDGNVADASTKNDGNHARRDGHLMDNEIPHTGRAAAASIEVVETPIEEVTNALYGKSVKFAMTHDIEMKLPEIMFDGATFRISPRSFEGNGIIAKLELIPKQEVEARLAGKFLLKKIQKFVRSKLLLSFLALVLIIKIIKIKFFWLLPLVIGVGAAKKLLLKFLLFLFPALSHLFKLCSYYQQTYHSTKYHHHHHLINHHHTIVPQWHSAEHSSGPELIYTNPPKGHVSTYLHGAPIHETYGPPSHEHYDGGWENSGPGLGSEYISDINRSAQLEENSNFFKPHPSDAKEIHVWGLGTTQPPSSASSLSSSTAQRKQQQLPTKINTQQHRPPLQQQLQQQKLHITSHSFNPFLNTDKQSNFPSRLKGPTQGFTQSAPHPVYAPPPRNIPNSNNGNQLPGYPPPYQQQHHVSGGPGGGPTAAQIAAQYDPARNNPTQQQQQESLSPEVSAQLKEALRIQAEQRIIAQQQKILENQPFVQDGQPLMPKNYDPFYSPILLKIDKIVEQLGFTDDSCKERLVCSMYKDPTRYSPHSNFVSSELSRDTSELQPVTTTNEAVIRFYRLIQAARDGQDQRDCLHLYPNCNVNTE